MKKKILPLLILGLGFFATAQTGFISGHVRDQSDSLSIEYASIVLFSASDSTFIDGTTTNNWGTFKLPIPDQSPVYLSVQFMGYKPYFSKPFDPGESFLFSDIDLQINNTLLEAVEVVDKAITHLHKLDKQVFDAKQFQNARGGTASDALRNLPSVSINSFGEISVRGSTGFLLMINNKPVQGDPAVYLQQIAANLIEDIEIITAPSAKYDPDGNAGIINITTRESLLEGLYLSGNVLVGLPSIETYDNAQNTTRYGADLGLNVKNKYWDISAGLNYRRYDISGRREGYVNTYLNQVLTEFPSDGERSFDEENYAARLAVVFTPDKKQSITAGLYAGKRTKDRTADILYTNQRRTSIPVEQFLGPEAYYDLYLKTGDVLSGANSFSNFTYFNENLRVRKGDFLIGSLDYTLELNDVSQLNISTLYERTILGGPTDNANLAWPNTEEILQLQFNDNDNPLDGFRFKVDFQRQFSLVQWETGYQYRYLHHPGDFVYLDRDLANEIWIENPLFTNSIDLTRTIHSFYNQFTGAFGKLDYNVGLRMEYFDRTVTIDSPAETYTLDRFNLFPSANLSYYIGEGWLVKAGYSRRIERTTTFKMTPFPEREHSETLEQGDAELLPEYIDIVEIGIQKKWRANTLFATAYYRHTDNVINRVNTVFNDTILNRIYTNVGTGKALGVEVGGTLYPAKSVKLFFGTNIYNYQIQGNLFDELINTSNTIYSINASSDFYLPNNLNIQLAFNYLSERITAQGRDSRFYNPSLTIRKSLLNKRANIALQWLNIDLGWLDSNEQRITTVRDNFFTTTNYVYEVDIFQLSFGYQLNAPSKKANLPESEFGKKEF